MTETEDDIDLHALIKAADRALPRGPRLDLTAEAMRLRDRSTEDDDPTPPNVPSYVEEIQYLVHEHDRTVRRINLLRNMLIAAAAIIVIVIGAGTTYIARTINPPVSAAAGTPGLPEIMPDFVGQTAPQAQSALDRYHVQIKMVARIDFNEPAGTIIDQDPVPGAHSSQQVTLVVSVAPPVVPDVTGKSFADAEDQLTQLGFDVKEDPVFDQQKVDGLVVGQDPPAGSGNSAAVTVNVVRRPVISYLGDMETVSLTNLGTFSSKATKANGKSYEHGLLVKPSTEGTTGTFEYDLSRQYRELSGELGLYDKSGSAAIGRVEIYGDGRQLFAQDVPFGTTIPVDLDVTDVLRLKFTVSYRDAAGEIVLGDFAALGLQSEVSSAASSVTTTTTATTTG